MIFAVPEMLWLLAVTAPLLTWFLVWAWRKKHRLIASFVQSRLLAQLTVGVSRTRQKARLVLIGVSAGLILLALARPEYGFGWEEVKRRGIDIVVAIDVSRSMLATDLPPNRLARAKLAALDLLKTARSDRLGLVAFAGTAFLQCPLTLDENAFAQSVNALDVGTIPQGGTAIAEAIDAAIGAFKQSGENYKALVLFTDGEDHEGQVLEAAQRAAKANVLIFPIGVGTTDGDRLRQRDKSGRTVPITDESGTQVVSKLDPELLRKVAAAAGGDYLPLAGPNTMSTLYAARLAPLPKAALASRLMRQYQERFQWPLALAILLLIIEVIMPERRRVERSAPILAAANPELKQAVALSALVFAVWSAQASPGSAKQAYEQGRFRESFNEYQKLIQKKPEEPLLHFNAGTAAYRDRNYDAATNELAAAVLASDPDLLARTYYNLGNAMFRIGEAALENRKAPGEAITNWQQSLSNYTASLKLAPQDADAKFNREVVMAKLQELQKQLAEQQKQQQQQQQQQGKSPQDQQSQPGGDQAKTQPGDPSQKDPSQAQKQESEKRPDQEKDRPQEEPQLAGDQSQPEDSSRSGQEAAGREGVMTPEQARQVLEASKAEERPWSVRPRSDAKARERARKDW